MWVWVTLRRVVGQVGTWLWSPGGRPWCSQVGRPYVVTDGCFKSRGVLLCGLLVEPKAEFVIPGECVWRASVPSAAVCGAACSDGVGGVVAVWCC